MYCINLSTDCMQCNAYYACYSVKNRVDKYLVRAVYTRNTSMWSLDKPIASLSAVI